MKKLPSWLKWGVLGLIIGLIYPLSFVFGFYFSFLIILIYPVFFILMIINPAMPDVVSTATFMTPIFYMTIGILLGRIFGERKPPALAGQSWIFSKGLLGDSKWRIPLLILIFIFATLTLFYIGNNTSKQSGIYWSPEGTPEGTTASKKTTSNTNTNSVGNNLNTNTATNKNNNEQISPSIKIESVKATLVRSDSTTLYCTVEISGTVTGPTCATVDVVSYESNNLEIGGSLMDLICPDWGSRSLWCTRSWSTLNQSATTKWSATQYDAALGDTLYIIKGKEILFVAELSIPKLPLPLLNGQPNCRDSEVANKIVDSITISTCN